MFDARKEVIIQRLRGRGAVMTRSKSSKFKSVSKPKGNYLREFSSITSIHGVMYLGEPKRPFIERVFWLVVMSLVVFFCGFQILQVYHNWLSSRLVVTINTNQFSLWDLPFPAFTFCSDLQLQNIENRMVKDTTFNRETEDAVNLICYQYEQKNITLSHIDRKHLEYIIENHRVECQKIVYKFHWIHDEIHSPCDYFEPVLTSYGICYSMNTIPHHLLYENNFRQSMLFPSHKRAKVISEKNATLWTPETGYSQNATPFDTPWRVTGDTVDNSVRFVFDLRDTQLRGDHCRNMDSGLTIFLHNPADVPVGLQPAAYVSGNSLLSISLSMDVVRATSKIKNWAPTTRSCYYQNEKPLKFFKIYTIHNCEIECRANNTLKQCGCNALYQPRDPETPVCGSAMYNCIRDSSVTAYSVFDEQINKTNNMKDCKCMPACTEILYSHENVEFFRNWTTANSSQISLTEETAVVMIYFKKKVVVDIQKSPSMPFNELLGNIGGLLGLFLGCSIVSFFEIIYFFIIRYYFDRRSLRKAKLKIMPNFVLE